MTTKRPLGSGPDGCARWTGSVAAPVEGDPNRRLPVFEIEVNAARIDAAWAAFFWLSLQAFRRPGIQVVAHHHLGDYHGVWLFRHHASLCLSVPSKSVKRVEAAARAYTVESLFSEDGVRALLGAPVERIIGPTYQGYVERSQFRPVPSPEVRALSRGDAAALRRLADACEADEWEHAGIALDETHVFGWMIDDHLVAAARCRPAWEETAHIGVVTHPAHRGCGYGGAVVSAATARGLDVGFVVLYQTLLANGPSVALATRLGYRPYATSLAVRLSPEGA
jgi:GNAT superfamily N-acetyltransferase